MVAANSPSPTLSPSAPRAEDLAVIRAPSRGRRWKIAGAIGLVALLSGALALALRPDGGPAYETATLTRGTLTERVTAVGTLEPISSVEVGSDLSGKVVEVLVAENDVVKTGQVLARLDATPFQTAAAKAEASVASARASAAEAAVAVKKARIGSSRASALLAAGAGTASEAEDAALSLESAEAALKVANAQLASAEATLADARQDLADTVIASPMDGVVIQRLVEPGQTVVSAMSATALFEVASDLRQLKVEVDVDEAEIGRVAQGQTASFTVPAFPLTRFTAQVASVNLAPNADDSVVSYGAELRLDNAESALRPGMTATATLEVGEVSDALLVPTLALRYRPPQGPDAAPTSGDHLWVQRGAQLTPVEVTVIASDGNQSAVMATAPGALGEGDRVVTGGGR